MKVINKKFNRNYQEIETIEAGIVLTGPEVKSVKEGKINIDDAFIKIMEDGQGYLINAQIFPYRFSRTENYNQKRRRKLLLHKKELIRLKTKLKSSRLTLVPKSCYNKGSLVKIEVALVRGRKDIEKRKLEKKRDIERQQEKEIKEYVKF